MARRGNLSVTDRLRVLAGMGGGGRGGGGRRPAMQAPDLGGLAERVLEGMLTSLRARNGGRARDYPDPAERPVSGLMGGGPRSGGALRESGGFAGPADAPRGGGGLLGGGGDRAGQGRFATEPPVGDAFGVESPVQPQAPTPPRGGTPRDSGAPRENGGFRGGDGRRDRDFGGFDAPVDQAANGDDFLAAAQALAQAQAQAYGDDAPRGRSSRQTGGFRAETRNTGGFQGNAPRADFVWPVDGFDDADGLQPEDEHRESEYQYAEDDRRYREGEYQYPETDYQDRGNAYQYPEDEFRYPENEYQGGGGWDRGADPYGRPY